MEYALVARWLVGYGLLAAAGYPVAARLLSDFRDRGAGFALPVALVVLTTAVYWVGHLSFGPAALAAGVVALLVAAAAAGLDWDALRDGELRPAAAAVPNPSLRPVAESAAVFGAAFLFLVAVRAADPAVHAGGGEKFLDYGLLKSLLRGTVLPPEDVWFANEPVQYYYGGHLMVATLAKLTLTPARYAYNLALAGFYGMVVTGAYALASNVADHRDLPRVPAGLAAAFAVGFASNLVTATRFVLRSLPEPYRTRLAEWMARGTEYSAAEVLESARSFSYWSASRVIPDTINEFPLFSWLNGDLHAHMMGTPFLLLAAALAFAYYRAPETSLRRRRALVFGAVPVLAGLQAVVDTWSYPSVFGVLFLSLALAPARPSSLLPAGVARRAARVGARGGESRAARELVRVGAAFAATGVAAVASIPFALPFLLGPATGAGTGGRHIAVLAATSRSTFGALFLVHGAFVAAFLVYLVARLRVERPLPLAAGFAVVAAVALAENLAVLLVVGPLLVLGWVALRLDRPVGYETVLIIAGAGLVGLVEFVYVSEQAGPGRMNTVFKTYMQVWVLWGPALGVVAVDLVWGPTGDATPARARLPDSLAPLRRAWTPEVRTALSVGFVALLLVSTSVYGVLALGNHFAHAGDPTLDATAFVEREHPGEAPAIRWLDERSGQPTLASAPGTVVYPGEGSDSRSRVMYTWSANPAASLTGVPTVAGWGHEIGYRGPDAYYARVRDVDSMYTSLDRRAEVLRKYEVEYVWVGPSERARYGDRLEPFGQLSGVETAYEAPAVTIYRVDRGALPGGESESGNGARAESGAGGES